jgi:fibronectin type 3 domain-containing protein
MKKSTLTALMLISGVWFSGCNPNTMMNHTLDPKLPKVVDVKAMAGSTAIGFEWKPLYTKGVEGINIYRTQANSYANSSTKQLTKVATLLNPFATHYVDKGLEQNSHYTYTFTTIKGSYESPHGKVVEIKTLPPMPPVSFFQGAQKSAHTIKLIWRPHPDKRVKMYKIEKRINAKEWKWVESIENRMMVEYIDNYVTAGNQYQYRIIAVGFDDSFSEPTPPVTILAR